MLLWLQYLRQLEAYARDAPSAAALKPPASCEDEEWGNENEAMTGEPQTPSSAGERAVSSGGASPASAESPAPPVPSPPRLRLNASLATDPALAPAATPLKREAPSPSPPPAPPTPQAPVTTAPTARDYLALSAAFPGLFSAAGMPPYMCLPCGIRYSSLSTLEAHRTYYCSHRRPKPAAELTEAGADAAQDESSGDAPSKTPRPCKQYACTHCSYSADRKVSLNRHMRMHSSSPSPPAPAAAPAPSLHANGDATDAPPPQDRYCADCDIRFSSTKTYRAHKTHYCSTRQVVKQPTGGASSGTRGPSSGTSGSAPASPRGTPPSPAAAHQPVLALATNPILILPYSLITGASVLPRAMLPDPDAPCFLLPNGTIQPMSRALAAAVAGAADDKEPVVLKSANRPRDILRDGAGSVPLDLSMRRTPDAVPPGGHRDDHEKENRLRSTTPEHIVCAPSLPPSPAARTPSPRRSMSPGAESSPKRRRRDSRGPTPKPPSVPSPPDEKFPAHLAPTLLTAGGLALRLGGDGAIVTPQVLVKQGVSKCKECNIVFCKHENYLVHKRHYCSSGATEERASPAPEPGPRPYRQLICFACGIRFNSLDNLATHQSYYCSKRETRSPRAVAATGAAEVSRPASGGAGGEGWKCPCCDVVSATAAAAQRHMESHAGVKAFRCTICRYRGNTLRGMRTHIRMHFPKKSADLQEESYIACVVEDEGRESTSPSSGGAAAGAGAAERVHRCASCAYTSTYRGNVVRHARLVHGTDEPDPDEVADAPPPVPPAPPPAPPAPPPPPPPLDIKKEPDAEDELPGPNYCKSCDISFKYINTYKAHKQFYCPTNVHDPPNNNVPPAAAPAASAPAPAPATLM